MSARALKLYTNALCPFCQRVTATALEKGIAIETEDVPLGPNGSPDWFKEVNPKGTVPFLIADGTKKIGESVLISKYLDHCSGPSTLFGETSYQRHRVEYLVGEIEGLMTAIYGVLANPFEDKTRDYLGEYLRYMENIVRETQQQQSTVGPFLLGDRFSFGELALVPFLDRYKPTLIYHAGYDLFKDTPLLHKMWQATMARDAFKQTSLAPVDYIKAMSQRLPDSVASKQPGVEGKYVLYGNAHCPFVDRSRLTCRLKKFMPYYIETPLHPEVYWLKYLNPAETVPVLVTPSGQIIKESMLIVNFIDQITSRGGEAETGAPAIIPRDDAEAEYKSDVATAVAVDFQRAMFGLVFTTEKDGEGAIKEAIATMSAAGRQLVEVLDAKYNGEGPFFGGATLNVADVALISMLFRWYCFSTSEMLGKGYSLFTEYPRIKTYFDDVMKREELQNFFRPTTQEYVDDLVKAHF